MNAFLPIESDYRELNGSNEGSALIALAELREGPTCSTSRSVVLQSLSGGSPNLLCESIKLTLSSCQSKEHSLSCPVLLCIHCVIPGSKLYLLDLTMSKGTLIPTAGRAQPSTTFTTSAAAAAASKPADSTQVVLENTPRTKTGSPKEGSSADDFYNTSNIGFTDNAAQDSVSYTELIACNGTSILLFLASNAVLIFDRLVRRSNRSAPTYSPLELDGSQPRLGHIESCGAKGTPPSLGDEKLPCRLGVGRDIVPITIGCRWGSACIGQ